MLRSFPIRLVDSAAGLPLIPCLLLLLACATPFPIERLAEGMTTETVRESFGEPEAISELRGGESSWTYSHEEQNWFFTLHPLTPFFIPINLVVGDLWKLPYVTSKPVVLQFEEQKLVRWEVIEPVPVVSSGYYDPTFPPTMTFPSKDDAHHARGHKHHHGHK